MLAAAAAGRRPGVQGRWHLAAHQGDLLLSGAAGAVARAAGRGRAGPGAFLPMPRRRDRPGAGGRGPLATGVQTGSGATGDLADWLAELQALSQRTCRLCETRQLAEQWVYRFLAAAHTWVADEQGVLERLGAPNQAGDGQRVAPKVQTRLSGPGCWSGSWLAYARASVKPARRSSSWNSPRPNHSRLNSRSCVATSWSGRRPNEVPAGSPV